jgi:single-strand DNA-binding protein
MSRGKNKVELIGNFGQDPKEIKSEKGPMCALTMATNERAGENEYTNWHTLIAFNKQAEILLNNAKKGRYASIEGRLQNRKWTDKDGVSHMTSEVVVRDVLFLDKKPE